MTRAQRDAVAMVLRCAADDIACGGPGWIWDAADDAGVPQYVGDVADTAFRFVRSLHFSNRYDDDASHSAMLETALLVEEGVIP